MNLQIVKQGKTYPIYIKRKRLKSIGARFYFREGVFIVSAHPLYSQKRIISFIEKNFDLLIKLDKQNKAINDDSIYFLGEKYTFVNKSIILNTGKIIAFNNKDELFDKLLSIFNELVIKETRKYEKIMSLNENEVKVKKLKSLYGVNCLSKRRITYSSVLLHYSIDIIDSVIIHELSHCFIANHSNEFYKVVFKFCPNYKAYRKKLRKGEFK